MKKKIKRRMGWLPDLPDQRDMMYATPPPVFATLPPSVDLRGNCPPVYDQQCLGSCTANAIAAAIEFEQIKQKAPKPFVPSRLFIYYNERVIEKTTSYDSGAQIRDGIKSVTNLGVCPEKEWPYTLGTCNQTGQDENGEPIFDTGSKFREKPSSKAYSDAIKFKVMQYHRVIKNLSQMKGCLSEGYPFVFGFSVYESFDSIGKDGMMPLPAHNEKIEGGHAVMAVGYDKKQVMIVRNSWDVTWGDKGYFYMPYSFITSNSCSDFWTIRIVKF